MFKKIVLSSLIAFALTGCATQQKTTTENYLSNQNPYYFEINEELASQTLALLEKRYPPAKTKLKLVLNKEQINNDYYAKKLIEVLTKKGYALTLEDTENYKKIDYKISENNHQIHLILNVVDEKYSRIFVLNSEHKLTPFSSWSRGK